MRSRHCLRGTIFPIPSHEPPAISIQCAFFSQNHVQKQRNRPHISMPAGGRLPGEGRGTKGDWLKIRTLNKIEKIRI